MIDSEEAGDLIGTSAAIRQVADQVTNAARADAKVLVTGESGVGKEVVARLIHAGSSRRQARLLTINCAGLPDSLLESELFGHVRGAFTGAYRDKTGLLELAHRGTVFMDEVGEMSLRMQAVLLRFLETGEIQRVGADRAQTRVDVRVIAATNRILTDQIAKREFREDLYFRLNVIHLFIPPLRDRRDDVPVLLDHFFRFYCAKQQVPVPELSEQALGRLVKYDWPGNVREIKNFVQRIMLSRRTGPITPGDLPSEITPARPPARADVARPSFSESLFEQIVTHGQSFWTTVYEPFMSRDLTRDDLRGVIRLGLEQTRGNYRLLVELFGMPATDYKRFLNFLRSYDCQLPDFRLRAIGMRSQADNATNTAAPATASGGGVTV